MGQRADNPSWRRLAREDVETLIGARFEGEAHDACRLDRNAANWQLEGRAVFRHEGGPAQLTYRVAWDPAWHTQQGHVQGWIGGESLEYWIARTSAGVWILNGAVVPHLETCVDLDFGFTPATNLLQLRRLALAEGQAD